MAKLIKQMYYTAKGEKKVNCYKLIISKAMLAVAGIDENDEIEVTTNGINSHEIIIKKA